MTTQKEQVYDLIKENPGITVNQISDRLEIKYNSANTAVRNLWFASKIKQHMGGWKA